MSDKLQALCEYAHIHWTLDSDGLAHVQAITDSIIGLFTSTQTQASVLIAEALTRILDEHERVVTRRQLDLLQPMVPELLAVSNDDTESTLAFCKLGLAWSSLRIPDILADLTSPFNQALFGRFEARIAMNKFDSIQDW